MTVADKRCRTVQSLRASTAIALVLMLTAGHGLRAETTLPQGGSIASGTGTITAGEGTMTISQTTPRLITDWNSFSVGSSALVRFAQPDAASVALNRVTGGEASLIHGRIEANGQVFLLNPQGVLFGPGAQVQTGAFVASALDLRNEDFLAGRYRFDGGTAGTEIVNQGLIEGNVVALVAPVVRNHGTLRGDVALAGGGNVLLDFDGDGLISVELGASEIDGLVENTGRIEGKNLVVLSSLGASAARAGVVNNTGTIEARGMAAQGGRILLLGDMEGQGRVRAGGTLRTGREGFVETSAAKVDYLPGLRVDTGGGEWLTDPTDIIVDQSAADALAFNLTFGNKTLATNPAGPGRGDIIINAPINWDEHTLTLRAHASVIVNAQMTLGFDAGLVVDYNSRNWSFDVPRADRGLFVVNAPINLEPTSTLRTIDGPRSVDEGFFATIRDYVIINTVGDLAAIALGPDADFALGNSLDLGARAPLADNFTGVFEGLGHTLSGPVIHMPENNRVGLFRTLQGDVRNLNVTDADIRGQSEVGIIAGRQTGSSTISNLFVSGGVTGFAELQIAAGPPPVFVPTSESVGGVAGTGGGNIWFARADVEVDGHFRVGGLVGSGNGDIAQSEVRGRVAGFERLGGIAGEAGSIRDAFADVEIIGLERTIGLFGARPNPVIIGGIAGAVTIVERTLAVGSITVFDNPERAIEPHERETHNPVHGGDWPGVFDPATGIFDITAPDSNFFEPANLPPKAFPSYVGVELTGDEGRQIGTYTATGWDFETVWAQRDDINDGYPFLRALYPFISVRDVTPVLVTVPNLVRDYGDPNIDISALWTASGCDGCIATVDWTPLITPQADVGTYFYNAGAMDAALLAGLDPEDYEITFAGNFLQIDPRGLLLHDVQVAPKVYNARTDGVVIADEGTLEGIVFGDNVFAVLDAAAARYETADAGFGRKVDLPVTLGGALAGNYTLLSPPLVAGEITPKPVSLFGTEILSRVYDGTRDAPVFFVGLIEGLEDVDVGVVEVQIDEALFDTKNVAENKPVTLTASLTGQRGFNYTLGDVPEATGQITPRNVVALGTVTASKIYDGNDLVISDSEAGIIAISEIITDLALSGMIEGDNVVVNQPLGHARYNSRNRHDNLSLTLPDDPFLTGLDAQNYLLSGSSITGTGTITPRPLEIRDVSIADKEYDATTLATVTNNGVLVGTIFPDEIGHSLRTPGMLIGLFPPSFQDKHVDTNKPVILRVELTGNDAGNYLAPPDFVETATILPRLVSLQLDRFEVHPKTYDATDAADVALFEADFQPGAILDGDEVVIDANAVSARFQSRHAGTHNAVAGSFPLGGADGGNYAILGGFLTTLPAEITPAPLVLGGFDFIDRLADGSTGVGTTGPGTLSGVLGGDDIIVLNLTAFASGPGPGVVPVDQINADLGGANPEDYEIAGFEPLRSSVRFFDPSDVQTARPQPDMPDRPRVPPGVPLIDGPLIQTALPGLFDFGPPPPPPAPPGQAGVATQDSAIGPIGPELRERLADALTVLREAQKDLQSIIVFNALALGFQTQLAQTEEELEAKVSSTIRLIEALIGDAGGDPDPAQTLRELDGILESVPGLLAAIGGNRAPLPDLGPVLDALTELRDALVSGSDLTPEPVSPAEPAPAPTPPPAVVTTGEESGPFDEEDPIELDDGEFIFGGTNDRGLFVPPPSAPRAPASTPDTDPQDSDAAHAHEAPTDADSADWVEDVPIEFGAADIIVIEPLTAIPNIEITRTPESPASGVAPPNGTDPDPASPPGGTPQGPSVITGPGSPSLLSDDPQDVEDARIAAAGAEAESREREEDIFVGALFESLRRLRDQIEYYYLPSGISIGRLLEIRRLSEVIRLAEMGVDPRQSLLEQIETPIPETQSDDPNDPPHLRFNSARQDMAGILEELDEIELRLGTLRNEYRQLAQSEQRLSDALERREPLDGISLGELPGVLQETRGLMEVTLATIRELFARQEELAVLYAQRSFDANLAMQELVSSGVTLLDERGFPVAEPRPPADFFDPVVPDLSGVEFPGFLSPRQNQGDPPGPGSAADGQGGSEGPGTDPPSESVSSMEPDRTDEPEPTPASAPEAGTETPGEPSETGPTASPGQASEASGAAEEETTGGGPVTTEDFVADLLAEVADKLDKTRETREDWEMLLFLYQAISEFRDEEPVWLRFNLLEAREGERVYGAQEHILELLLELPNAPADEIPGRLRQIVALINGMNIERAYVLLDVEPLMNFVEAFRDLLAPGLDLSDVTEGEAFFGIEGDEPDDLDDGDTPL